MPENGRKREKMPVPAGHYFLASQASREVVCQRKWHRYDDEDNDDKDDDDDDGDGAMAMA